MTWSAARTTLWRLAVAIVAAATPTVFGAPVLGAAMHSVDVTIVAGKNASDGGFDFNGYQKGAMTVTVPTGWQVVVHFENAHTTPHSLVVLPSGAHQQSAPSGPAAFSGAATKNLAMGLPKGSKETLTFEVSKAGTYEFVCGVPAHAVVGMWDIMVVSATANAPSVTPPDAAPISVQ